MKARKKTPQWRGARPCGAVRALVGLVDFILCSLARSATSHMGTRGKLSTRCRVSLRSAYPFRSNQPISPRPRAAPPLHVLSHMYVHAHPAPGIPLPPAFRKQRHRCTDSHTPETPICTHKAQRAHAHTQRRGLRLGVFSAPCASHFVSSLSPLRHPVHSTTAGGSGANQKGAA